MTTARASETDRAWTSSKSPSLMSEPISSSCWTGGLGRETSLGALKMGGSGRWDAVLSASRSMAVEEEEVVVGGGGEGEVEEKKKMGSGW